MDQEQSRVSQHLQHFNLLHHQLRDQAEAKIPEVNNQINRLFTAQFVGESAFVGDIILERAFPPGGPVDAGQVVVAVLRVPGGIGALYTDSDAYREARRSPDGIEQMAMLATTSFEHCDPIVKARLLDQVSPLMQKFLAAMDIPDPPETAGAN